MRKALALLAFAGIAAAVLSSSAHAYPSPYTCSRNFYISTTGSDTASCGASTAPCASIGGAMSASGWNKNIGGSGTALTGGDCLNVAAGTYTASSETWLYQGGNANTATGYVAIVGDPSGANRPILEVGAGKCSGGILGFNYKTGAPYGSDNGSFMVLDGLEVFDASNQCQDYLVGGGAGGGANTIHHIMVLNSHVHGALDAGGIGIAGGDYITFAGNTVHDNKSEWQSGISVYEPSYIAPNSAWPWDNQTYHIQFLQNSSYNNGSSAAGSCNAGHTDGEGIIADDWQNAQRTAGVAYVGSGLIQSNTVYGNGGKGIQIGPTSLNVTVDSNTSSNDNLDPTNCGTWRGELHNQDSYNTTWTNNSATSTPLSGTCSSTNPLACNVSILLGTTASKFDHNVSFTGNTTYGGNGNCGPGNTVLVQTQNQAADCQAIVANNNLNASGSTPQITSALTANGTVGTAFNYQITATNSPTSYGATPLPAGTSVNTSTGLISGTPTAAGQTTSAISATNSSGTGQANLVTTISAGGGTLIGTNTVGSTVQIVPDQTAIASSATAIATGTVNTLGVNFSASSGSTTCVAGIYSDNNGQPGSLLGQASVSCTPHTHPWVNLTLSPGISVTQGTNYWIAAMGSAPAGSNAYFHFKNTKCNSGLSAVTNLTALPATWATGSSIAACAMAAYGH